MMKMIVKVMMVMIVKMMTMMVKLTMSFPPDTTRPQFSPSMRSTVVSKISFGIFDLKCCISQPHFIPVSVQLLLTLRDPPVALTSLEPHLHQILYQNYFPYCSKPSWPLSLSEIQFSPLAASLNINRESTRRKATSYSYSYELAGHSFPIREGCKKIGKKSCF